MHPHALRPRYVLPPMTVSAKVQLAARALLILLGFMLLLALPIHARAQAPEPGDLTQLSLDQLSQAHISVSSFGRKDEDLWQTPAAVFVIAREDIDRSGVSSIPELLRRVPGVQVAQLNASTWAVSVRGFNSANSNKLLVLINGRSVYTEIFSGTQWDQVDLPLENVERIEVIRGPGAVAWGANAVNGVINVITRHPRSTQGLLLATATSRIEQTALLRFGGAAGDRIQYTAFFNYLNRYPLLTASGASAFDGEDTFRGGAALDWRRTSVDSFSIDGDLYTGRLKQQILDSLVLAVGPNHLEHESIAGGHILGRWQHTPSPRSDFAFQVYLDDQSRQELANDLHTRNFSADLQNHLAALPRNDLVAGAELRLTADHFRGNALLNRHDAYFNFLIDAFVQDEIGLIPHRLLLTLGTKIEDGTLAGFQLQPSARLLFAPDDRRSFWLAVSRAVVAPSLQDTQLTLPIMLGNVGTLPLRGQLLGDPDYQPEKIVAYEAGTRFRLGPALTLDLAAFYNSNTRVQSLSFQTPVYIPGPPPSLFANLLYTNGFQARTGGTEAAIAWKPRPNLAFQTSYTWLQAHSTQVLPGLVFLVDAWNAPRHAVSESATWSVTHNLNLNGFFSFVGALPASPGVLVQTQGGATSYTPAYNRMDLHLTRKLPHSWELEAGGTNLLSSRHLEFTDATSFDLSASIPRSASFKLTWRY